MTRSSRGCGDSGFTVVEVIIAIVMLGIVASGALWFFINGMQTSSNLQRDQTAVSVATSAMEESYTFDPRVNIAAGVSGLVIGRSTSAVNSAFATLTAAGVAGVSDTYALSDPAGGTPSLPIQRTVKRANVDYTVYTLVGACYRNALTNGSDQDCEKIAGNVAEPASVPNGKARLLRIIVAVTWKPIGDECAGTCTYSVSTLVDPSTDLEWNRIVDPVAADDSQSVTIADAGKTITLDVLDNDYYGSVPSYPVSIVSGLPAAAGTLSSPAANGTINYTPPAATKASWVSGIYSFTYRLKDSRGATATGKVEIWLKPEAANDSFTAFAGSSKVLDVAANDLGSPKTYTITDAPKLGSLSISGTTLTYAPSTLGYDTFTYYYTDASGLQSPPATATINVQAVTASDQSFVATYRDGTADMWVDVTSTLVGTNDPSTRIVVKCTVTPATGSATGGQLRVDGTLCTSGTRTGSKVEFNPPSKAVGEWKFPFALTLGGYTTTDKTATMRVPLSASDDASGQLKRGSSYTINFDDNDSPANWAGASGITVTSNYTSLSSTCRGWINVNNLSSGYITVTLPGSASTSTTCTLRYTLTGGGGQSSADISFRPRS